MSNQQKGNTVLIFILIVVLLAIFGAGFYKAFQVGRQPEPQPTISNVLPELSPSAQSTASAVPTMLTPRASAASTIFPQGEVRLKGVITENDNGCNRDGVCKVKVSGKWVITNLGGDPTPEMAKARGPKGKIILADGTVAGTVGTSPVGKQVEVYGKIIDSSTVTLYGSPAYYLKFL